MTNEHTHIDNEFLPLDQPDSLQSPQIDPNLTDNIPNLPDTSITTPTFADTLPPPNPSRPIRNN